MKKLLILLLLIVAANAGFTMSNTVNESQDSSMVYDFPEQMAHFPGDADAMDIFIRKNLYYPPKLKAAGVQGKVYIQFIVEKDGSISNITIRRECQNAELDQEAVNVIKKMPNWIPGTIRGKKVRVKQTVPVKFSL
ncbi:MAG: energy transducer TonB [Crocinitomix sp.]|nr:energy transducer TonB [Crocinitomix sp.]|tara:strand:+ start:23 stop:430 length:408 start_codon:yes stop_codon:yes gene_type:complete